MRRASLGWLIAIAVLSGCAPDEGRVQNFDGPWERHTIDDSERGADGVRVADVNGDGLPDVTTGWEQAGITRVYLHPGFDDLRHSWPRVTVGETPNVEDAVFADVDGDGHVDVVSSSEGATQVVSVSFAPSEPDDYLESSAWTTRRFPATEGRRWMYAVPMDVDGNGAVDLVVGGKREGAMIGWLESPGDGDLRDLSRWKLHEISPAGWIMSMDEVDMNEDGLTDLLVSDRTKDLNGVRWLERPEDPLLRTRPWLNHLIGAQQRSPTFVAPVLAPDATAQAVVVPSGGERLTLFEREDVDGQLWSQYSIEYGHRLGTPKSAAVGDIDRDGVLDVVIACTNLSGWEEGLVWLSHATQPEVTSPEKHSISGAQGEKYDRVELLDIDGDGDLDVLTTEEVQQFGVIWYENPLLSPAGGD